MYHLSGLGKLSLSITLMQHDSSSTNNQGLTRLLNCCPNLTDLRLSFETHYSIPMNLRQDVHGWLSEDTISCTNLRSLHLSRFSASEEAMSRIILANPSLEHLALMGTSLSLSAVPPGSFPTLRVLLGPIPSMIEQLLQIGAPELREIRQMGSMDAYSLEHFGKLAIRAPRLVILGWNNLVSDSQQDRAMELSFMLPTISVVDEYGACFKFEGTALEKVDMKLRYTEKKASQARLEKDEIERILQSQLASGNPIHPSNEAAMTDVNTVLQSLELTMSTLRKEEEMLRATSINTD
jgi:hypothetical protein